MTRVQLQAHGKTAVLNVDPTDHIGRVIHSSGRFYEQDLLEDAYRRLSESQRPGVVIDVGAHVGNHSIWFSKICGRNVVAVEPNIDSALQLNSHARVNKVTDQVAVYGVALGYEASAGRYEPGPPSNSGMGRVVPDPTGPIATIRLDELVEATLWPDVALIKIDVEGTAVEVLRGAASTLAHHRPLLYVEGDRAELEEHLGPRWRNFGQFGKTPTWGFEYAE